MTENYIYNILVYNNHILNSNMNTKISSLISNLCIFNKIEDFFAFMNFRVLLFKISNQFLHDKWHLAQKNRDILQNPF